MSSFQDERKIKKISHEEFEFNFVYNTNKLQLSTEVTKNSINLWNFNSTLILRQLSDFTLHSRQRVRHTNLISIENTIKIKINSINRLIFHK